MAKRGKIKLPERVLDARPDSVDFRDRMFVPTLVEVPEEIPLSSYRALGAPILDQGREGACTGFGLAAVANCLLSTREIYPSVDEVSARMLYEMAKRHDEWPGEEYSGSSARGAMKGWHKHGVCSEEKWPYQVGVRDRGWTDERAADARNRPLGAYYRVNHKNVGAMHAALAEVGILYATASVHGGWDAIDAEGVIPFDPEARGGHAFSVVGFDRKGFWIQNSWGEDWGLEGFALVTYDDWLKNGTDCWVARLGAAVDVATKMGTAALNERISDTAQAFTTHAIRSHIISIGNDGELRETGTFGTSEGQVRSLFEEDFPRITKKWKKKRLLLYAHGGLTSEESAIQRVADYREGSLDHEIYPLAFVWKSDFWTTMKNILRDAISRRRPEGFLDATKDFMLDRLDDALEPLARQLSGKAQWDEMKENARLATERARGAIRIACRSLARLLKDDPNIELHIVGHSAGAVMHAPLVQYLTSRGKIVSGPMRRKTGLGLKIGSCTLWAPACTVELFKETYVPAIKRGGVQRFALFALTDAAERNDDCANIYHKSLLYLVSNAFEHQPRIPLWRPDGVPILGMEKFIRADRELEKLFQGKAADLILSPNAAPAGSADHSESLTHGGFDDDEATMRATLARILGKPQVTARETMMRPLTETLRERRSVL